MALHLFARSLGKATGLGKFLQTAVRPAGIAALEAGNLIAVSEDSTDAADGEHLEQRGFGAGPIQLVGGNGLRLMVMFGASSRGFASAALDDTSGSRTGTNNEKQGRGGKRRTDRFPRKQAQKLTSEEYDMRKELLNNIREWPLDVNLDEKLSVERQPITAKMLRSVMLLLLQKRDPPDGDLQARSADKEQQEEAVETDVERDVKPDWWSLNRCSPDDARRILNLFEWWQRQPGNSDKPQRMLVGVVLRAISTAGLTEELKAVCDTYAPYTEKDTQLLADILNAYYAAGMHKEGLELYRTAREKGWECNARAVDFAVRMLQATGGSKEELLEVFKSAMDHKDAGLINRKGFVALLESGITVEELRSLSYKDPDRVVHRLIQALASLGWKNETDLLVRELLEREQPPMPLIRTVVLTLTLIRSGYPAEAQQLVKMQEEKHKMRFGEAVAFFMRRFNDARTSLNAARLLEAIEGSHKTSKMVHAEQIVAHFSVRDTESAYQTYKAGKELNGYFDAGIYGRVIAALARDDRADEAEGVLADYFRSKKAAPVTHQIGHLIDSPFSRLCAMYLRKKQPEKIVQLIETMVEAKHWVSQNWVDGWVKSLETEGYAAEAERVAVEGEKMKQYRPKPKAQSQLIKARTFVHESDEPNESTGEKMQASEASSS